VRFFLYEAFEYVIAPYWMANKQSVILEAFVVLMTALQIIMVGLLELSALVSNVLQRCRLQAALLEVVAVGREY